ncbi:MAG: DNA repair protein RecN [Anaerolineae bacterium]|nr:DNA repair protein RecN [Anaerolineae bacterium]
MLAELDIHDLAIIDELHLTFTPGFTALTGETGAGKSIIIDAVELALGGRADATVVRSGAERALVEATFRLEPEQHRALQSLLQQEGLEGDAPDLLQLSREVRANGRSVSRINGRAVTLSLLREAAEGLVDIHGQSEHLSLLRVQKHVDMLDRYGGLQRLRAQVADWVGQVRAVRRERAELERSEQELARRTDLLEYQIAEIETAALQPEEKGELAAERTRLTHASQLAALSRETLQILSEGNRESGAVIDLVGQATRSLESLHHIDPTVEPQLKEAEDLSYRLQDLAETLRDYGRRIEQDPRRLAEVEERLELIRSLERKYGPTIPDVLAYGQRAREELEAITHSAERIAELGAMETRLLDELAAAATELSLRRREAARHLAQSIEQELQGLHMQGAQFEVDFQWQDDPAGVPIPPADLGLPVSATEQAKKVRFDRSGIDQVEFLVSPNPGEPPKPLVKIASGGETSRLMLALKTVLSRADETPTLIFDEIDQGIGGRVGATVGEKLWRLTLARGDGLIPHQVLCVTHLPQLAGFGDLHLRVEKHIVDGRTVTHVNPLLETDRVEELAQMLGASGESTYRSAKEILLQVAERKKLPPD